MNTEFEQIIELNKKFAHSIFFNTPDSAGKRRAYERYNSKEFSQEINGVVFYADCDVSCSCRHVYHNQHYSINSVKCNKTKFINIMEKVEKCEKISKKDRERFFIEYKLSNMKSIEGYEGKHD